MGIDFQKLVDLKKIREDIDELKEHERSLRSPLVADISLVGKAYEIFSGLLSERDCAPDARSVTQRKKFLFIALWLFAPGVLLGDRMPNGFRKALSETLGVDKTVISGNCSDIVFLYQNYRDFSRDVDELSARVIAGMQDGLCISE